MNGLKPPVILSAIIVGVAGFIGYNMMYMPKQQQVAQVQQQIAEERQTQQAQADVSALLKQLEDYRKRLPSDPDPSWISRQILDLAETSGIQLDKITQTPAQTYQGFTHFALAISFADSYHGLGRFLDAVERAEPFFRVEKVGIKPPKMAGDPPEIEVVLGTLYVPPVVQGAPAAAGQNP